MNRWIENIEVCISEKSKGWWKKIELCSLTNSLRYNCYGLFQQKMLPLETK
jgi:hypothetical protein